MVHGDGFHQLVYLFVSGISDSSRRLLNRSPSTNAYCLEVASENIVRKLERDSLGALLKQETSFSDQADNSAGGLTTAVSSHPANVGAATGLVTAQVLVLSLNLFASILAGLIINWRMAIVCIPPTLVLFFSVCNPSNSRFTAVLTVDH
jgi:ABC-type multidrug transport system fused ATPase/permease subunit